MLELVLVRHGQSYGNLDRELGPDTDLTDLGREQATQVGRWLADQGYDFTACYCSTLRRARQTVEMIGAHLELEITFDSDLREAEGPYLDKLPLRTDPLAANPPLPFNPEYATFRERVMRAAARILAENESGQVLVVAHGGTLATMLRGILGVHTLLVRTEQTAVHCLRWEEGRWNLQYLNRQEHLISLTVVSQPTPADGPRLGSAPPTNGPVIDPASRKYSRCAEKDLDPKK